MQADKTIAHLFQEEPTRWGQRGDPYLRRDVQRLCLTTILD
jgi:hypothetical protein